MTTAITHFEIVGKDSKSLRDFYTKLFGWKIKVENMGGGEYAMIDTGAVPGGGIMDPPAGQGNYVTIYFGVDDLKSTLAEAEKLGGKTIVPPTEIPGVVTFALFMDPVGNCIGITLNSSAIPQR